MRDAFVKILSSSAEDLPQIMLITGDLGFGVLTGFADRFPRQFINAGVAEQNMTAIAAGLALDGRKVFTYTIANFATLRCLEQIRNDVCYHNAGVVVVCIGGGFSYGQLGMSHFATEDLAIMRALPNMKVIAPTGIWETQEATKALIDGGGPAYLRLDKGVAASAPRENESFKIGRARVLRDGRDITLIGTGAILSEALTAADRLAEQKISCRVISVHTIKPFDDETILSAARETGGIITVEEHNILGGLGSAVSEVCLEAGVAPKFFARVGINDLFPTIVGDQDYLRGVYGLNAAAIEAKAREGLRRRAG
jgi:transketolase